MPDAQILNLQDVPAPSDYTVPGGVAFILKAVNAEFDGSGAAGSYLPAVEISSDSGHYVARASDTAVEVAAGGSANVSFFPRVKHCPEVVSGPRCVLLGSANGTDTLIVPLTVAVPGPGVLQLIFCQASVGPDCDEGSGPSGASDSQGNPGWDFPSQTQAFIGLSRNSCSAGPPIVTTQVGSLARACTTGDLGIGDTVTVTFDTIYPPGFYTAGLLIWQRCYYTTIKQFGSPVYDNGDARPDTNPVLTELSWDQDYGPGTAVPDRDAILITAMGAYPAQAGFAPFVGTRTGEIASGQVSIAAACMELEEGTAIDPGGTWPTAAAQLAGNYQMVEPRTFS